jgi:hypothetical protein
MIIDCSHEPREETPRNHCDLNTVMALNEVIGCPQVILTHISHQFDVWMMDNPLPSGIEAGMTGWCWFSTEFCRVAAAPYPAYAPGFCRPASAKRHQALASIVIVF